MRRQLVLVILASSVALAACATATPTQTMEPSSTAAAEASVTPASAGPTPSSTPVAGGGEVTFRILPDQTEAWFMIDEVLAGSPNTVIGKTNVVSGKITGEFANPQGVLVSLIQIDMSELRTDNSFRNRAIRDVILQTGDESNRFATFQATSIDGLPDQVTFGTAYDLSITGDLTIHGVTRPVTFTATVTPMSEGRLEGTASVTLDYAGFDIHVLRLPDQVASVGQLVTLGIDFVAETE